MQRSKRVLVSWVSAVALVVIALIVWAPFAHDGGAVAKSSAAQAAENEGSVGELAPDDMAAEVELASGEARRAVDVVELAPEASAASVVSDVPAPSASFAVRVVIEDDEWLPKNWHGSVRWTDDIGVMELDVVNGRIGLPREPSTLEQFENMTAAGLAVRLVEFVALEASPTDAHAPRFEVRGVLEPGATLVWASSVADADRGPVHLVFGGMTPPTSAPELPNRRVSSRRASVIERRDVTLPFELPRVAALTSVWIGGARWEWRSFPVDTSSPWIEVALQRSATIRVLHDGQVGAFVVATDTVVGTQASAKIVGDAAVELTGLSATTHRVWIQSESGEVESRVAEVRLTSGETAEVDLRAASLLDGRGSVRIVVREAPRSLVKHKRETTVVLMRPSTNGSHPHRLPAPKRIAEGDDSVTFEAVGIDPGRYEAVTESHVAWAEFEVRAGETTDVELDARCIGFVDFVPPAEVVGGILFLKVTRIDAGDGREITFPVDPADRSEDEVAVPLVCGTYRATASDFGSFGDAGMGGGHALASDTFVVAAGETTVVAMRARKQSRVELSVVNAATGEPIAFDVTFWVGVRARAVDSNADVRGIISFVGTEGAYTGAVWTLGPFEGLVQIEPPEDPFWTFEALEPQDLSATTTITLRATAK